jgi:hypothetical protein
LKRYYIHIKKYVEVWKQDPKIEVMLSLLFHLSTNTTMKSAMKIWNDEVEHVLPQYAENVL